MSKRTIDGIINVRKPPGMTSADVVYKLRRLLGTKKIGHTGTLDPEVEGVLPICIGKATRLVEYLTAQGKAYRAEMTLGITTTSQDNLGEIIHKCPPHIVKDQLIRLLPSFQGRIKQIPPMHSAVHKDGKRLYEYARAGIEVERDPREVEIQAITLLRWHNGEYPRAELEIFCSKGTYIRTLCHDLGQALECGAYMSHLLRFKSGPFWLETSITLNEIESKLAEGKWDFLLPLTVGLDLPVIQLPIERVKAFCNGLPTHLSPSPFLDEDQYVQVHNQGRLLGIGAWREGQIHPHKVLIEVEN